MTSEVYLVAVLLVVTLTGVQVLLGSGAITAALALTASLACEVG